MGSPAFGGVLSGNCGSAAVKPARAKRVYLFMAPREVSGFKVRNDRLDVGTKYRKALDKFFRAHQTYATRAIAISRMR